MTAPASSDRMGTSEAHASLADLRHRIELLEQRVRTVVRARREGDSDPDDRFRGLYLSDADVDRLLAADTRERSAPASDGQMPASNGHAPSATHAGGSLRVHRLARAFGLDDDDLAILIIGLAPDIDRRFEQLYAYLQDDVTRRRPSIGLALELCGASGWAIDGRRRLTAGSALVDGGLIRVEEVDRPFLTRPIRVPDRVVAHLLGADEPDHRIRHLLLDDDRLGPPGADLVALPETEQLARALGAGVDLTYLRDRVGSAASAAARAALHVTGHEAMVLDLDRLSDGDDAAELLEVAARDARLREAGIVAGPVDTVARAARAAVSRLADAPLPVFLLGRSAWETSWSRRVPWVVDAPVLALAARQALWAGLATSGSHDEASLRLAAYRLAPEQIVRAVRSARVRAGAEGREPGLRDLQAGARAENASGLDRLARRVEPRASWRDLVLPDAVRTQLRELAARARRRDVVIDDWGMGGGASHGRGVTALFAGDPGTGKTMSAEVIAAELGLDLYVIDLSSVVDKYIGETEKNLDRIFSEADRINGVLLFDEADALFGQRSEVRDARDRYANVEIAYLLQRMEQFDGLAILTTNLRANIDEAFLRRLDAVVDFPMPEEEDRHAIWRLHLPDRVPRAEDVDLRFMAARFRLSGGHIRNVCLTAAYLAAERDGRLTMEDLVRATEREYGKLGRLTVEAEFGPYLGLLAGRRSAA